MSTDIEYPQRDDLFGDEHVRSYRETDGVQGYRWKRGTEILILTTVGRRSGERRDSALIFREVDGDCVIVASKGGYREHPGWFLNMQGQELVDVQLKGERFEATHRVAEGEERERLWKLMTEVWPDYDAYQQRTDRRIPVVVLSRTS